MNATLRSLGGARTVTGSAHHLELRDASLLVDCGLFQGLPDAAERNRRPPIEHAAHLDAVVLTHGHLDHVGRLPLLLRAGFRGRILGHPATLAIAEIVLYDALTVATMDGSARHDVDDVAEAVARFVPVEYGQKLSVGADTAVTLFDAGHILGSASVLVESAGVSVLFSGDLGRTGMPILRDPNTSYPADVRVDHVVIESTYGDREHPPGPSVRERLRQVLRRALADNGKVLVPAFAIGRTQELLYHLRALTAEGELAEVPVVVDGPMGLDITSLYERHTSAYDADALQLLRRGAKPLSFDSLYGARGRRGSEAVREIRGAAVIVAGSGMCTGGRILGHLEELLPDPRTDVLFVGYQAHGTLGRQLQDGASQVVIGGRSVRVRAAVTAIPGLSAHADRRELISWLRAVPGSPRCAYVTHGEPRAASTLAASIESELGMRAVVPAEGERFVLAPNDTQRRAS